LKSDEFKEKPKVPVFTTSGVFTVPKGVKSIDVFCVGGGSNGTSNTSSECSYSYYGVTYLCRNSKCSWAYGIHGDGGTVYAQAPYATNTTYNFGSGGKYYTKSNISVEPGQQISITVGAGGGTSKAGSLCTSDSGSTSAYGTFSKYCSSGYYVEWSLTIPSAGLFTASTVPCPLCGENMVYSFIYTAYVAYRSSSSNISRYAQKGGYAYNDTTKGLYGCGGGYRSGYSGSGDGGTNGNGYSGIVLIKWDK
jgi:hypothetical protein